MINQLIMYIPLFFLFLAYIYIIKKNKLIKNIFYLKSYRKEDISNIRLVKLLLILFLFLIPALLVFYQKVWLAFILFLINMYLCKTVINIISNTEHEITIEIADFINTLIKEFSIQDNLINIIEIALQESDGVFIKEMFNPIFNELLKNQDKNVFSKSLQNYDNLWMSSLLVLLDEYTKNSDRELMLTSLNDLYDIMDINVGMAQETKSKMNVMLFTNNLLLFIGIIGGIVDFIINSYSRIFFILTVKGNCFLVVCDILMLLTLIVLAKMINGFNS